MWPLHLPGVEKEEKNLKVNRLLTPNGPNWPGKAEPRGQLRRGGFFVANTRAEPSTPQLPCDVVMLIEGYELYLESIALLLVAFVFVILVVLSLVEWSGNKRMDTRVAPDGPAEEEAEGENGQTQDNNALVSYNNRPPPTDTQMLIDRYMGKVDFNMKSEDLDKPWFHQGITRAMAQDMLKGKEQGSFLVRPSSHRGSYAMSWVKDEGGEISHSLIHGLFPGFSLKQSPTLEERYACDGCHI